MSFMAWFICFCTESALINSKVYCQVKYYKNDTYVGILFPYT